MGKTVKRTVSVSKENDEWYQSHLISLSKLVNEAIDNMRKDEYSICWEKKHPIDPNDKDLKTIETSQEEPWKIVGTQKKSQIPGARINYGYGMADVTKCSECAKEKTCGKYNKGPNCFLFERKE